MKYTKPEVALIGYAVNVIASGSPKNDSVSDGTSGGNIHTPNAAYDLDE